MKFLLSISFIFFFISPVEAEKSKEISGIITYEKTSPKGTVFVFGRKLGEESGPPVVVKKIDNPTFPLKFKLGPDNIMMRGTAFEGPLRIRAKLSPSGGAMDKTGPSGATPKDEEINPGDSDIKIQLKDKN